MFFAAGLGGDTANSPLPARNPVPGGMWATAAPVPTRSGGVWGMSVAKVDWRIIAALGVEGSTAWPTASSLTRIYNPDKDTWSLGKEPPVDAFQGVGVSHKGRFYHLGGLDAIEFGPLNIFLSYELVSNKWDTLKPMAVARSDLAAAVLNGAIYAVGGADKDDIPLAAVERYDIKQRKWANVRPLPFPPRQAAVAAALGGKLYVFGGFDGTSILDTVVVYHPRGNKWSGNLVPAMPTPRAAAGNVATIGRMAYLIGGIQTATASGVIEEVEAYDKVANSWATGFDVLPTPRVGTGTAAYRGRIYVFGGLNFTEQPVSVHEVFTPK